MKFSLEQLASIGSELCLEADIPDGKTRTEIEYEFYAEIEDETAFEQAINKIHQEQWKLDIVGDRGSLRVRKSVDDGQITYEQTLKLSMESDGPKKSLENSITCSVDFYNGFVAMASGGQIKDRYIVSTGIDDLNWEIDRFYDATGKHYPIVKIDLETKQALNEIPAFPKGFKIIIKNQKGFRTQEEIDTISKLMQECSHQTQSTMPA